MVTEMKWSDVGVNDGIEPEFGIRKGLSGPVCESQYISVSKRSASLVITCTAGAAAPN